MSQFIEEIISKNTLGNEGYLLQKGLIPLSDPELQKIRNDTEIILKKSNLN
jgi:hypothetical protein